VNDAGSVSAGMTPGRFRSVENAFQEVRQMPVTEACLSGLCDICLYQNGLCSFDDWHWEDSHSSTRSGK